MKKYKYLILIIVLVSFFINCPVYAEKNDSYDYGTDAVLKEIEGLNEDYNYDLVWDDMSFTYIESKSYEYNNTTHEYDLNISEHWTEDNNSVNITNNSYEKINVSLLYVSEGSYDSVIGNFTPNNFSLYHNEYKESKLKLYGKIDNKDTELFTIGTITIRIQ